MATSYPDRTNARGIWRLSDITRNIKTEGNYPDGSTRAIHAGGASKNDIGIVTVETAGNATDFGDLVANARDTAGFGNSTRGVICGDDSPINNVMQYIHFKTTGNTADFGDMTISAKGRMCTSTETKGFMAGGFSPGASNVIESVTIASTGNGADFGDLTQARGRACPMSSPTRGVFASGLGASPFPKYNIIDFFEMASSGNAVDFGDIGTATKGKRGGSNATRGVLGGEEEGGGVVNTIEYITIASKGDAINFGDLTRSHIGLAQGNLANQTRGIFMQGYTPGETNVIDFITFASAGDATDFGDATVSDSYTGGCSNGHGGIKSQPDRPPELYSPTGRPVVHGDTAGLGDIGLFQSGGYGYVYTIDYIKISSAGNGTDFGDTATKGSHQSGAGSSTRVFQACFASPGLSTNIDYGLFSTKGNHADFGDTTDARDKAGALSNNTRACWLGGRDNTSNDNVVNVIDYITMATIGNASDFGDLTAAKNLAQGVASNTRGVVGGGATPSEINVIEYITIGSTGNATDFGDLSVTRSLGGGTGASSTTRGLFAGGGVPGGSSSDVIDYITISSTGNATDFGDLAFVTSFASGLSNNTRAVFSGFNNTSAPGANSTFGQTPHISYVTIASTGDITNFGDLSEKRYGIAAASNGHGGLS